MKVSELIERLKELPQDAIVVTQVYDETASEVEYVLPAGIIDNKNKKVWEGELVLVHDNNNAVLLS